MAKQTLLQMTQSILNAMSSDEVNSIGDSTESLQVANIIQAKYYDILTRGKLPDDCQLFQLTPSNDGAKPTQMTLPAGVSRIDWLKYYDANPADGQQVSQFGSFSHGVNTDLVSNNSGWNTSSSTSNTIATGAQTFTVAPNLTILTGDNAQASSGVNSMSGTVTSYSGTTLVLNITTIIGSGTFSSWVIFNIFGQTMPGYKLVHFMPIEEFLDHINRFNPGDENVRSFFFTEGGNNFTFLYKNDIQPRYYTVLSNLYVIFDSYDSFFDTTLQASKILCYGQIVPPFSLTDNFTPLMDDNQFPLLVNEAKALAFYELKQAPHAKAEQEIKRQWSAVQKNKEVAKLSSFDQLPSFGRMPRTGGYGGFAYGPKFWN